MRFSVPPAPQPSFALKDAALRQSDSRARNFPASKLAPLDAAFLRRVKWSTLWLGGVFSFCVLCLSHSTLTTSSFALGAMFGVLLLVSQEWFVRRAVGLKLAPETTTKAAKMVLVFLLPAKWIAVTLALGWMLHAHLLNPFSFVAGCTVVQIVIVAKVVGRLMQFRMRPLRAVYVDVHQKPVHHAS